jgi:HSP20 family protein
VARIFVERRETDDDLRRLLEQLTGTDPHPHAADCRVPLDVVETATGIDVIVDLVGVDPDAVQIVIARDTLLITGVKRSAACGHEDATFHVAERVFGRFARAVRLAGAFDVARGDATLRAGELRVTLPRIEERRGREHRIPVRAD